MALSIAWTALKWSPAVIVGLIGWEHTARKNKSNIKPSTALTKCVEPLNNAWFWCGDKLARLSSFYTYLKNIFSGLDDSIHELFKPMFNILTSFTSAFKGYFATAEVYKYPGLIIAGTVTLLLLLSAGSMFLMKYTGYGADYVDYVLDCMPNGTLAQFTSQIKVEN
ncbi:MAG TPA: hypothetical protein VJ201_02360 [Candidatus Babeliales bacterium]|nr:hypothetical protein [Candidatus Babeliales bacterium]